MFNPYPTSAPWNNTTAVPWNNLYQPYNPVPNQPSQAASLQLTFVNGMDSAKAYPTQPNSRVALFDENEDIMYIKTTDASNFPTIKRYRYVEEKESTNSSPEIYVTKEEFDQFKEEVLNAQQSLSAGKSNPNPKSKWNGKQPATNKEYDGNGQEQ